MSFIDISRAILRGKGLPTSIARRVTIDATHPSCFQEAIIAIDLSVDSTAALSLCCTYRSATTDNSMKCSLWSQQLSDNYVKNHFENDYLVTESSDCMKEYTEILIEAFLLEDNVHILSNDAMTEISILLTYKIPTVFQGKMKLFLVQSNVDVGFFNVMRVIYSLTQPVVSTDSIEDATQPATKKMKTSGKHAKKVNVRGLNVGGSRR